MSHNFLDDWLDQILLRLADFHVWYSNCLLSNPNFPWLFHFLNELLLSYCDLFYLLFIHFGII